MSIIRRAALAAAAFVATAATAAPYPASYQVPVPTSLQPYASFKLAGAAVEQENDHTLKITYCLPRDIAGAGGQKIVLSGTAPATAGDFFAVSENANGTTGTCVESVGTITCMLHYGGLHFDAAATETYLKQKYAGAPDLPERIQVMRTFSGNAIGILTVDIDQ